MNMAVQEVVKAFKKRLLALGFTKKTDRLFWYDNNGLFYVVSFKMKGREVVKIGLEISHAALFDDGVPKQGSSAMGGWIGRGGLCNGGSLHRDEDSLLKCLGDALDADFLERAVREFFSSFVTAADWQAALGTTVENQVNWRWYTDDWRNDADIFDIPIRADAGGAPPPWRLNEAGGMKTSEEFRRSLTALLAINARHFGWHMRDELQLVRRRGAVYECVCLVPDDVSVFCGVRAFIGSDAFARPMTSPVANFSDDFLPGAVWIRTSELLGNARLLKDLLEKAAIFCSQFNTAQDWLAYIEGRAEMQSLAFGWFQRFKDVREG